MKTSLYYFSGTGNSLKVAKDLASNIGNTEIISVAKIINQDIEVSSEVVGIIFPVYMFGAPLIIDNFFKKALFNNKYIFIVATCGGFAGGTVHQIKNTLKKKGERLNAGFVVKMPDNYIPFVGAMPLEKQKEIFQKQEKRTKYIASRILNLEDGIYEQDPPIFNSIFLGIYKIASSHIPKLDKNFWADDNCDSCGICKRVCPVNNIEIKDVKPSWKSNCEQCFACLQWCPKQSIQYGKSSKDRKRYHNPSIQASDLYNL